MHKQRSLNNLITTIKQATKYDRQVITKAKVLSASMAGSEPLINYLTIMHGIPSDTSLELNASDLGSLFHLSLENIMQNQPYHVTEHRMQVLLPGTDWHITGSADLIDLKNRIIYDYKLTTTKSIEKINNNKTHEYILQLSILNWLYCKTSKDELGFTGCILAFDKKASKMNKDSEFILNPIYPELLSLEDTESLLRDITSYLDPFIDSETLPPQCASNTLFWYKKPGEDKATPMKCKYYCNHSNICPHYSKTGDLMKSLGIPKTYKYKSKPTQRKNK